MAFEVYLLTGKTGARGSSCQLAAVISCYARHSFLFVKYRSKLEAKLNLYCSTDFSCNVWVQASFQVLKENIFIHTVLWSEPRIISTSNFASIGSVVSGVYLHVRGLHWYSHINWTKVWLSPPSLVQPLWNICVTDNHDNGLLVLVIIRSFFPPS